MDTLLQVTTSWILPALFFWFLLSLIAMVSIEGIQQSSESRQISLEGVIETLIGKDLKERLYEEKLVNPLKKAKFASILSRLFANLQSPLKTEKPSYISQALFAKVVMDWILPKSIVQTQNKAVDRYALNKSIHQNIEALPASADDFRNILHILVAQADLETESLAAFLGAVEHDLQMWFLEAVNQMSPRYKARLQGLTLLISVIVALVANFDVISITSRLWTTSKYPEALAISDKTELNFEDFAAPNPALIMALPVGWDRRLLPTTPTDYLLKVAGLYLGGFFIAFGSQYVYNLTKRQYIPSK